MEITEVKVFPVRDKKLRAFASIVFDGVFMVNDIKVIQGRDGFFISMPSRRKKNGRFKDIAHPLNQETRQQLEDRIIGEYRRLAESSGEPAAAEPRPGDEEPRPAERAAGAAAPAAAFAGPVSAEPAAAAEESAPAAAAPPEAVAEPGAAEPPVGRTAPADQAVTAESAAAVDKTAAAVDESDDDSDEEEPSEAAGKSLDEIAEAHLSDSYWTT